MKNITKLKTAILALGLISGFSVINANATNEAKGIIRFIGKVTDQTCKVAIGDLNYVTVRLPDVTVSDFANKQEHEAIGTKDFSLQVENCIIPTDTNGIKHKNIQIKFTPDKQHVTEDGYLLSFPTYHAADFPNGSKSTDTFAEGIALRIRDRDISHKDARNSHNYIHLKEDNIFSGSVAITNTTPSIPLVVEYVVTDPQNISVGKVTSKLEYTFNYH